MGGGDECVDGGVRQAGDGQENVEGREGNEEKDGEVDKKEA